MKPFHEITFCPTGLNDENVSRALSKKIIKLGGLYSKDLTRQVNVLVCGGSRETNKYKFAVRYRHDIVFIDVGTVDVFYQRWLAGDDMKDCLGLLRDKYSSGPLSSFYIFIGRIQAHSVQELEQVCHQQNCFKCNSTHFVKDVQLRDTERRVVFISDSLKGTRVQAALEQGLPIVHYKWLLDCRRRNATLEYDPHYLVSKIPEDTPFEKIGLESCECWDQLVPQISREPKTTSINPLTKFKSQGDKIWERAMARGPETRSAPVLGESDSKPAEDAKQSTDGYIFESCSFEISSEFPEEHVKILRRVIEQNGGKLSHPGDYLLIPSTTVFGGVAENDRRKIVTEFFIERCLHYRRLISPPDSWSKPFLFNRNFVLKPSAHLLHNNGRNQLLHVAITGFHGVELLHLTKILQIMEPMGIKFMEYLNKSTDLLIINLSSLPSIPKNHPLWQNQYCNLFVRPEEEDGRSMNHVLRNSMKRKIEFVKRTHSIPVVTPSFLFEILLKALNLRNAKRESVHLNNINWCIICPRGVKEHFMIELVQKKTLGHIKGSPIGTSLTPSNVSIKEARKEFLEKIKVVEASVELKKRPHSAPIAEYPADQLTLPMSHAPVKRFNTGAHNFNRSSTWGNLMSNQLDHDHENESAESINIQPSIENDGSAVDRHTQVTYGTARNATEKQTRRLTRKQTKNIEI